ncbi:MAG: ATP-binding protein [Amaricoccus sp.]|uniref:ATP-binding protein n=1 Tax=Amaricoccus sp. TaxID=1872485 RepID=UPI0033159C6A
MSLRRATILTLATLLTVVGVVAGLASYWIAGREANEFLDLQLRQMAQLVGNAERLAGKLPPHDGEDDLIVEIRFADGRAQVCAPAACRFPPAGETGFSDLSVAGNIWRVFALALPDRTVQVGQRHEVRREMAQGAAIAALLPLLLLIPMVWIVVDVVLRRTFRRLEAVTGVIAARDAADVTPIPESQVLVEVRPLVSAMNGLLARLRALMDQQRAFVSDAAHQLRTPLAALTLEIGNLRTAGDDGMREERLAFVEAAVRRASGLVGQLLRLARQEAGPRRASARVPLAEVVRETIGALAPLAIARGIDLGLVAELEADILGDREDFRTLIETLLDNAVRYTPEGGTVDVEMRATPEGPLIRVLDTGPGIPADALPRLFERFFRVDGQEAEGSGLGLAIADLIARRHGITLDLTNRTDRRGVEARMRFRQDKPLSRP